MAGRDFKFHDGEKGAALAIHVKMSQGKSCFSKVQKDGTVVIELELGKGETNTRLMEFLSTELAVPLKRIQIVAGEDGNKKLISIIDMSPKEIQKTILERID